ncbi:hypothetical protein ACFLUH_03325 [Chloroflexota bacterium]
MEKLRKAGLLVMFLSFVYLMVYAVTHGLNEYYDLASSINVGLIFSMPCLFVTAVSWHWPRRGGIASVVLASVLLTLSVVTIMTAKVPLSGQELPALSFSEVSRYILPYAILLCGSILALVAARRTDVSDLLPSASIGSARVDKLRKTGLLIMLISGVVGILTFITLIGISGDSMPASNIFSGLVMGLAFATIPLILAAVAWRWPHKGSMVAMGVCLTWFTFVTVTMINGFTVHLPWIVSRIVYPSIIVLLVGSCLVFVSARRISRQNVNPNTGYQ